MTIRFIGKNLWDGCFNYPRDIMVINKDDSMLLEIMAEYRNFDGIIILSSTLKPGFFKDSETLTKDVIHMVSTERSLIIGVPDGKTSSDYKDLVTSLAKAMGCNSVKITDHRTSELISYLLALKTSMDRAFSDLALSLTDITGSSVDAITDSIENVKMDTHGDSGVEKLMTDDNPALVEGIRHSDAEMRRRFIDKLMSDGTKYFGLLNMEEGVARDMANMIRKNNGRCAQIGTTYRGIKILDDVSMISEICQVVISSGEPEPGIRCKIIRWN